MTQILLSLVMTHITIISVTIYLHRCQAHRSVELHPLVSHFMRFWLWFTTGMITKEWVAIHRKHHRFSDEFNDPHSPQVYGIWHVLFKGAFLYNAASRDQDMVEQYGAGTPNDWIEKNLYTPYHFLGITLLLFVNLLWFSYWGLLIWAVQMIWIPFWAAGVINGIGHCYGYKNGITRDHSRNIVPWGIVVGGEELHNNHHLNPAGAKLSHKWWEFDIGWAWIKILESCKLATVRNK